jgi:ParB family chromosome partitioning protein
VRQKREPSADAPKPDKSAGVRDLEARLSRVFGTRVSVEHRGPGGKVQVSYSDLDELDRIIATVGA